MFQNKRCNKHMHTKAQKDAQLNSSFNKCNKEIMFKDNGSFLYPFQVLVLFTPMTFAVITPPARRVAEF